MLETFNTPLTATQSTFISLVNKISELKMTTDQIVPSIVANQKQINPQDNLENKIKHHCSTSLDSIHTKLNIIDTKPNQNTTSLNLIHKKLDNLENKLDEKDNNDYMDRIISKLDKLQNNVDKINEKN